MKRWTLVLIAVGFALAIVAIARDSRLLAWIAIPILTVALGARFIARRRADRAGDSDSDPRP